MPNIKLIDLPENLFYKNMTLDNNTINSLALTCKYFSFFRKNSKGKGGAYLLMEQVIDFNLKAVKQLAEKNPDWMFEQINYQSSDEVLILSPLQQSFRTRDSYVWKILLKIAEKNPEHLKRFEGQMNLQIDCFDIQPLLTSYDEYLTKYDEICREERITKMDEEVKNNILMKHCSKVGLEQSKLPKHMLYEMFRLGVIAYESIPHDNDIPFTREDCSEIFAWYDHNFNIDTNKPPLRKFICCIEDEGIGEIDDLISLLKKECVAVRGEYTLGAYITRWAGGLMKDDKRAFEALYRQRDSEYIAELSSFKKIICTEDQIHQTTFQQ